MIGHVSDVHEPTNLDRSLNSIDRDRSRRLLPDGDCVGQVFLAFNGRLDQLAAIEGISHRSDKVRCDPRSGKEQPI
jgi:hypothetical protein